MVAIGINVFTDDPDQDLWAEQRTWYGQAAVAVFIDSEVSGKLPVFNCV